MYSTYRLCTGATVQSTQTPHGRGLTRSANKSRIQLIGFDHQSQSVILQAIKLYLVQDWLLPVCLFEGMRKGFTVHFQGSMLNFVSCLRSPSYSRGWFKAKPSKNERFLCKTFSEITEDPTTFSLQNRFTCSSTKLQEQLV